MNPWRKGVCLLAAAVAVARPAAAETNAVAPPANAPALWFPVGETLAYKLRWGFIPVGKARVQTEWVQENGRVLLAIRYRAKTNHLFDALYPIDDFAESIIEPWTFLSVRFTLKQWRRHAECDETTVFDYERRVATWESRLTGKIRVFAIEPHSRDLVAFLYYLRKDGLKPEEDRTFRVMADDRLFDIRVKTFKPEPVKLPLYGKIEALRVEPEANFKGLMIENGSVTMWASRDARRLGIQAVVRGSLASMRAVLCHVEGPGDDFWVQAAKQTGGAMTCGEDAEVDKSIQAVP